MIIMENNNIIFGANIRCVKEDINLVPFDRGIYFLFDFNGNLVYVGKSSQIKTRLRTHFSTKRYSFFSAIDEVDLPKNIKKFEEAFLSVFLPKYNWGKPERYISKNYTKKLNRIEEKRRKILKEEVIKKMKEDVLDERDNS